MEATGGRAHYIDGATKPYNRSARHAPVMKSRLGDNELEALDHQIGTASRAIASHYARSGAAGGVRAGFTGGHYHDRRALCRWGKGK